MSMTLLKKFELATATDMRKFEGPVSSKRLVVLLFLFDSIIFFSANVFSSAVLHTIPAEFALLVFSSLWKFTLVFLVFYTLDLYNPHSQISGLRAPWCAVFAMLFVGMLTAMIAFLIGDYFEYESRTLKKVASLTYACFLIWAIASRYYLAKWMVIKFERCRWLVIANSQTAVNFWSDFRRYATNMGEVVFLINDLDGSRLMDENPPSYVGNLNEIGIYIKQKWSGIIIADTNQVLSSSWIEEIVLARLRGVKVYDLTDFYERFWFKVPVFYLEKEWFAVSHGFLLLHDLIGWRMKRVSDIILSFGVFIITLPMMFFVALLVKLDSRGPVFFKQQRVGMNERIFTLYKFRTMIVGAEKQGIYTLANDKRVTRIGKLLRIFRLDEFPQIWNVLKGDMSLIGPRAEWTECVKKYECVIPFYHLRHLIKPGITGWAQIFYPYGASIEDAHEKLQYDIYYIKNYSFFLDMAIVFKTVRVMIFGKGQ